MISLPAWRCARTSWRMRWIWLAIAPSKAGSTQYFMPMIVLATTLGGAHSAAAVAAAAPSMRLTAQSTGRQRRRARLHPMNEPDLAEVARDAGVDQLFARRRAERV